MAAVVSRPGVDSPYAWRLAIVSMLCVALGGGGIYLPVIGLKEIAADFGDQRAVPSFAYMIGFLGMAGPSRPEINTVRGWLDRGRIPAIALVSVGPAVAGTVWPQIYRALLPD